jgi:hypothetical protein
LAQAVHFLKGEPVQSAKMTADAKPDTPVAPVSPAATPATPATPAADVPAVAPPK